jgi:hypothetical protein
MSTGWNLPWQGGCRCGQLRIRVTQAPLFTSACHCTGCQRMTGGAFSLTITVPGAGFEVTQGETVMGGLRGPEVHHHHCDQCKSWVFTRVEGIDTFVNVRASMLDECRWFVPFVEVWTSEKLPWATTPAVHRYATQPEMDAYPGIIAAFAEAGVRPAR